MCASGKGTARGYVQRIYKGKKKRTKRAHHNSPGNHEPHQQFDPIKGEQQGLRATLYKEKEEKEHRTKQLT